MLIREKANRKVTRDIHNLKLIPPHHRSVVVDWMACAADVFGIGQVSFQLCVKSVDIVLSSVPVTKKRFALCAATSLCFASEFRNDLGELEYMLNHNRLDFSNNEYIQMAELMKEIHQNDFSFEIEHNFISFICLTQDFSSIVLNMSLYLSNLIIMDGGVLLNLYSSQVAFGAIALARYTLNQDDIWPQKLKELTGYSIKMLSPLIRVMHSRVKALFSYDHYMCTPFYFDNFPGVEKYLSVFKQELGFENIFV